jgi:hypothetical protein
MMDLKDFVAVSIDQIFEGIRTAREKHSAVAPPDRYAVEKSNEPRGPGNRPLDKIDFDIAVTTTEATTDKIAGGIKVLNIFGVGLDASKGQELQNSTASRIKFSVPVVF